MRRHKNKHKERHTHGADVPLYRILAFHEFVSLFGCNSFADEGAKSLRASRVISVFIRLYSTYPVACGRRWTVVQYKRFADKTKRAMTFSVEFEYIK